MRFLLLFCVLLSSPSIFADAYIDLYQTAGWPQQQAHFASAVKQTQLRYQDTLPSAVYQALVNNSNKRFAADAMHQRAQSTLREQLHNPEAALAFLALKVGVKSLLPKLLPHTLNNLTVTRLDYPT